MPNILTTGNTFLTGNQVTATTLNNAVNLAEFDTNAYDGVTIGKDGSGSLYVLDSGIVAAKLASNSVTTVKITDANVTPAKLSAGAPSWSSTATTIANSLDFASITTSTTGNYGRSGTTVTISMTAHGMATGMIAALTFSSGTGGTATLGTYLVTVSDANTFTITDSASGTITGSPSCSRTSYYGNSRVRGSETIDGNLSVGKDVSVTGSLSLGGSTVRLLTSGTAVSASGTAVDFTSIPSWVKRITVVLSGVSTNGSSMILFRLGTSGTPAVSGYTGAASTIGSNDNSSSSSSSTAGVPISGYDIGAGSAFWGNVIFTNVSGNAWSCSGVVTGGTTATMLAGSITLGGVLNILRITTAGGTAAFDAGTVNIMYE
jgi:hypothetical protein